MKSVLIILFLFLLSKISFSQEEFPNPTRGVYPKEGNKTLRAGTWNYGGKSPTTLKEKQPFPQLKKSIKVEEMPVEFMQKYNIDILCLNNVKRFHYQTPQGLQVEPAQGSKLFGSGYKTSHKDYYFFQGPKLSKTDYNQASFSYEYGPIIYNQKVIHCSTPIPNISKLGGSVNKSVHIANCLYKPTKRRFLFACTHTDANHNELRRTIFGLDQMMSKAPYQWRMGDTADTILAGDFNSYPNKHNAPRNYNITETTGWRELEIRFPKKLKVTAFNDDDITFTQIKVRPNGSISRRVSDDLIHSAPLDKDFIQKFVLPVQSYPLKPSSDGTHILPPRVWSYFWKFNDHLPVAADYDFSE